MRNSTEIAIPGHFMLEQASGFCVKIEKGRFVAPISKTVCHIRGSNARRLPHADPASSSIRPRAG